MNIGGNYSFIGQRYVQKWFHRTATGYVFLPGDMTALPIDEMEFRALRASTYEDLDDTIHAHASKSWNGMIAPIGIAICIFIFAFFVNIFLNGILELTFYAALVAVLLLIEISYTQWEDIVQAKRDSITRSLGNRTPLPHNAVDHVLSLDNKTGLECRLHRRATLFIISLFLALLLLMKILSMITELAFSVLSNEWTPFIMIGTVVAGMCYLIFNYFDNSTSIPNAKERLRGRNLHD